MSNSDLRTLRESPFSVAEDSHANNLVKGEVEDGASQYATPSLSLVASFRGRTLPVDVRLDEAALLAAAESGDVEAIRSLLAVAKLDSAGERGSQALVNAAKKGHTEVVRVLLEAGASVYAEDRHKRQALHWAAMRGWAGVAKTLLDAGASPNCEDAGGYMPLHYAAYGGEFGTATLPCPSVSDLKKACQPPSQGHLQAMQVLVEAGADVNKPCASHGTPLHIAAAKGVQPVSLLLDAGADPLAIHREVITPLHSAAMGYQPDAVTLLLMAGADPRAGARGGVTPLIAAMAQLGVMNTSRTLDLEKARKLGGIQEDKSESKIKFEDDMDGDEDADWKQGVHSAAEVSCRLREAGDPAAKVLRRRDSKEAVSGESQEGLGFFTMPIDLGLAKAGFKVVQEALVAGPGKKLMSCTCTVS